jgi:hypothetical protein
VALSTLSDSAQLAGSPLLTEYLRTRRWNLGEISQKLVASYMCSNACSVSEDETNPDAWERSPAWRFRNASAYGLLLIKADASQNWEFWHEHNKLWVAAGDKGLFVPDPYLMTYEKVLAEVYADITSAKRDPRYQKYEAGCRRMSEARRK